MSLGIMARCAFVVLCASVRLAWADTAIFINEIHYDNVGADTGEGVEIAGPAGTDLTGWKVIPYNGSGGGLYAPDATVTLSGLIPTTCGGYGVISVPIVGLQNGAPDGLALVDSHGVVIQFLSYEGMFTATNGPASGLLSSDIGVSESGSGAVGLSLQLSGNGTQYSNFTWQADAASTFGACNTGQTFGTPPDIAPAITSTLPANGATNVALNASLLLTFSEAVTLTSTAADVLCTNSGSHSVLISGTGNAYTLNPETDFAVGENCTVTIAADQVTDLDGMPDTMAQDYSFSFATVPGDVPPTVATTAPALGAIGFPRAANLQITFSEPVALDTNWFQLSCDASGVHTAVVTGSGALYTLNPDIDFAAIEHCTWIVLADHVYDLDGTPDAMTANVTITFDTAAGATDYYAGVDTSSGPALEAWLHNRIKDHTAYPYSGGTTNTWTILRAADEDPMNTNNVVDVYKNVSYPKTSSSLNREHTWPNSYGFNDITAVGGNPYPPYTDCHMLYMADSSYNESRSNKPYGNCAGTGTCVEKTTQLTNGLGGSGHSNLTSSTRWETWDHRKGDVARAILYMSVRYDGGTNTQGQAEPDLRVTDNANLIQTTASGVTVAIAYMGMQSNLLDWNDLDPPDQGEQLRNEVVYSFQHNRNPFIDHPEWARCAVANTNCPVIVDEIFHGDFETPVATVLVH
ncbi:hypothetical protein ELE36_03190 [Pseudolysobacter antarcticus]|uniref:SbsA Ig-like domain-containing protein n=1 Tax=Pseudolysobacter antarcticus TaxID=2511995 RepID=A0A411HG52_9GAMM|nr:endonuclease [Pseudolysobacter antarcticus]QBB69459.1 hypothetical protein ELE36_03190 [Pseudolysobacter antarcticus]